MAWEFPLLPIGQAVAAGDYNDATDQYLVVKPTTAAALTITVTTAVTDFAVGVLQDRPSSGMAANVVAQGITKVRVISTAHTAIVPGTKLTGGASGGAEPSTSLGSYVLGRSLSILAANATGIVTMLLTHQGAGSTGAGPSA